MNPSNPKSGEIPRDPQIADLANQVSEEIFGAAGAEAVPSPVREAIRSALLPHYVWADSQSVVSQKRYFWSLRIVYLFSALAVAIAATFVFPAARSNKLTEIGLVSIECALLLAIAFLVLYARSAKLHARWVEFRLLAEQLRFALYASACGFALEPRAGEPDRDDWSSQEYRRVVADLMREIAPMAEAPSNGRIAPLKGFIESSWIVPQLEFHRTRARRFHRNDRWLEGLATSAFCLSLLSTIACWVLVYRELTALSVFSLCKWAALALPAAGASLMGYRGHRQYQHLGTLSDSHSENLTELRRRLGEVHTYEQLMTIIREMQDLATGETSKWHMFVQTLDVRLP